MHTCSKLYLELFVVILYVYVKINYKWHNQTPSILKKIAWLQEWVGVPMVGSLSRQTGHRLIARWKQPQTVRSIRRSSREGSTRISLDLMQMMADLGSVLNSQETSYSNRYSILEYDIITVKHLFYLRGLYFRLYSLGHRDTELNFKVLVNIPV